MGERRRATGHDANAEPSEYGPGFVGAEDGRQGASSCPEDPPAPTPVPTRLSQRTCGGLEAVGTDSYPRLVRGPFRRLNGLFAMVRQGLRAGLGWESTRVSGESGSCVDHASRGPGVG